MSEEILVQIKDLKKYLRAHPGALAINKVVASEMLLAQKYLKKSGVYK